MLGVNVAISARRPRPELRLDVWGAVGATLLAWVAFLVAQAFQIRPDPGYAMLLFTATPVCAAMATPVLWARGRAEGDEALGWTAAGLAVGVVAMVLQLISFPTFTPGGGPLGTGNSATALLYLVFHWTFLAGAVLAMAGVPLRWRPHAIAVGLIATVGVAVEAFPIPALMTPEQRFTPLTIHIEHLTTLADLVVTVLWLVRSGRRAPALHGWIGVALSFTVYDVLLNAVAGRRFDEAWWASITMRVVTYAVLALGAGITVLVQLRRHEQYAEAELDRRETELLTSLEGTNQLLASAEALTAAVNEADVARVVAHAASTISRAPHTAVEILDEVTGGLHMLASVGLDARSEEQLDRIAVDQGLAGPYVMRTGRPVYTCGRRQTRLLFPDMVTLPAVRDTASVAALPLRMGTGRLGALVVADDVERPWREHERQLLRGLADQAAQALQRAHLFERERATAEALQHGMLPHHLGGAEGVQVEARYLPGAQGMSVGGDWYDSIPLPDGRNVLVVGDVMGKGAVAAAVMGRARSVVRALVTIDPSPTFVLECLDRVAPELIPDGFITLLYVLLDPVAGTAAIGRAGHLPLVLAAPDGRTRLVEDGGSPAVGIPTHDRTAIRVPVRPGSTLALFTDGLVEDRVTGLDPGLDRLTGSLARHHDIPLGDLADHLVAPERVAGYDDVCLLLARLTHQPVTTPAPVDPAAGGLRTAYPPPDLRGPRDQGVRPRVPRPTPDPW